MARRRFVGLISRSKVHYDPPAIVFHTCILNISHAFHFYFLYHTVEDEIRATPLLLLRRQSWDRFWMTVAEYSAYQYARCIETSPLTSARVIKKQVAFYLALTVLSVVRKSNLNQIEASKLSICQHPNRTHVIVRSYLPYNIQFMASHCRRLKGPMGFTDTKCRSSVARRVDAGYKLPRC